MTVRLTSDETKEKKKKTSMSPTLAALALALIVLPAGAAASSRPAKISTRPTPGHQHGAGSGAGRHAVYEVNVAGFLALSDHEIEAPLGQGVMPAIRLALDHIESYPTFSHVFRLRLLHNDTQCSASVGMKAFFDMLDQQPRKVMILGGSCTPVTDSIAKTSKHFRIPVLSYADTHPMFTRKSYPNFFRIVPSENAFNAPRVELLKAFNWTRVGTLYQNEPRFALAHNNLVSLLDGAQVELTESQGFVDDLTQPLTKLKEKDVRIILASFNATWARRVFCAVYRTDLYGGRYQWIIAGPRQERWWREEDPSVNCTSIEILTALEGAFVVDVLPLDTSRQSTINGLTSDQYLGQYNAVRNGSYSQFHGYAYDAVWTAACTIKKVIEKLHPSRGRGPRAVSSAPASGGRTAGRGHGRHANLTLDGKEFDYRKPDWEKLFLDALRSVNFVGVTGPIKFTENNERSGRLIVKQIVGAHEQSIGEYDNESRNFSINVSAISWMSESKQPPRDRTITIVEPSRISVPVFATLTIVAAVGIVLASSFLAVNIRFRNQRYIKMSSPYLNNMIIIGCLLTYTSVILLGLDSHLTSEAALPVICTARIWTLMAGFTLAFGSMFSKTWRVHSIFTDVKLNKKAIKDYQLFMVVGVLLAIDIAILTTWQVIAPFYRETKKLEPYPHPTQDNVEILPENEYCQSIHMTTFVGSIYAYKGLLMAFGCFLAWETRNVNIPALNDSKYIGMSVYNVVIMCVIGGAVSFILEDEQDVSYVIISIFIIFCTTGTLCLVFVPKLIELRRNPQGTIEKRGVRSTVKPTLPGKFGGNAAGAGCGKHKGASQSRENSLHHKSKTRNAKLRKELRNLDDQLQKLLEQLGEDNDSLAKDGPSFSYRIDSDCRVPSVSGADTMSLCSLISSPEQTSTSPHHSKDNGSKGAKNQSALGPTCQAAHQSSPPQKRTSVESASAGNQSGTNQSAPVSAASTGSDSTAPATSAAMWTAISSPLLLIGHVLSKSMDLQQSSDRQPAKYRIRTGSQPSSPVQHHHPPPHLRHRPPSPASAFCEYVSVERHAEPPQGPEWIDRPSSPDDASPSLSVLAEQERQQLAASVQFPTDDSPAHPPTDISETLPCRSFSSSSRPSASRTKRRRRRGLIGSYSLTEIGRQSAPGELTARSLSVQAVRDNHRPALHQQHCKSDSSFNYESNVSEMENSGRRPVNCFEYRSLESLLDSASDTTISRGDVEDEEANSTRVNVDESSLFNSPRDLDESSSVVVMEDDPFCPLPSHGLVVLNGSNVAAEDGHVQTPGSSSPPTPVNSTASGKSRSTGRRANGKSQSTRERRRRPKSTRKSSDDSSRRTPLERSPSVPAAPLPSSEPVCEEVEPADLSILPIFKQLIVQKQIETGGNNGRSQPINFNEANSTTGQSQKERQLASCPDLFIKCDVVEYF